jgi:putative transcriptional regulator
MTLYNEIKKFRTEKDITQEQLGSAVGVSRQTIVAIEKGNYTPSLVLGMELAKFFKVSVEQLFRVK